MVRAKKQSRGLQDKFVEFDIVFAKVRGYFHWPAIIVEVISEKSYEVRFYGTHQTSIVRDVDMIRFNAETKEKYSKMKMNCLKFQNSLIETESKPDLFRDYIKDRMALKHRSQPKPVSETLKPSKRANKDLPKTGPEPRSQPKPVSETLKPSKRAKKDLPKTGLEPCSQPKPVSETLKPSKRAKKDLPKTGLEEKGEKFPKASKKEPLSDNKNLRERNTAKSNAKSISSDLLETSKEEPMVVDIVDPAVINGKKSPPKRRVSRCLSTKVAFPTPETSVNISKHKEVNIKNKIENNVVKVLAKRENVFTHVNADEDSLRGRRVTRQSLHNNNISKPEVSAKAIRPKKIPEKALEIHNNIIDLKKTPVADGKPKPDGKRKRGKSTEVSALKKKRVAKEVPNASPKQEVPEPNPEWKSRLRKSTTSSSIIVQPGLEKRVIRQNGPTASANRSVYKGQPVGIRKENGLISSDVERSNIKKELERDKSTELMRQLMDIRNELANLDSDLVKCLTLIEPDMIVAIKVLEKLDSIKFTKLMILQHRYVERALSSAIKFALDRDRSENVVESELAKEIRQRSMLTHEKIRILFGCEDPDLFAVKFPQINEKLVNYANNHCVEIATMTELPAAFR